MTLAIIIYENKQNILFNCSGEKIFAAASHDIEQCSTDNRT